MNFKTIPAKDIEKYIGSVSTIIIDLREKSAYKKSHIPTAINIPYEELTDKRDLLYIYDQIVVYCERGGLSMLAAREFSEHGYRVLNVAGGIHAYRGKLSIDENEKVFHNKQRM